MMASAPPRTNPSLPSLIRPAGEVPTSGRASLHSSVTTDSGLPTTTNVLSQTASPRYIKQFQLLLDHQRQVFDEERSLWQMERADLHERLAHLELAVEKLRSAAISYISTPPNDTGLEHIPISGSAPSTLGSRHASNSGAGDEVWRGSKPFSQPTRSFLELTSQSNNKTSERLPSIAEDSRSPGKTIAFSDKDEVQEAASNALRQPSIHGSLLSRSLDGINFKSGGLPPAIVEQVLKSSPSAVRSPSDTISPSTMSPPGTLRISKDIDPYTKDAGHTPLARHSDRLTALEGGTPSSNESATRNKPEQERPLAPHPSRPKMPSERQDSYFPIAEDTTADSQPHHASEHIAKEKGEAVGHGRNEDEDLALKGPLGLTNDERGDAKFLSDLDRKLSEAALKLSPSQTGSSLDRSPSGAEKPPGEIDASTVAVAEGQDKENEPHTPPTQAQKESKADETKTFETPESEPRLRIKRSMNFGSAFGEVKGKVV